MMGVVRTEPPEGDWFAEDAEPADEIDIPRGGRPALLLDVFTAPPPLLLPPGSAISSSASTRTASSSSSSTSLAAAAGATRSAATA